MFGPCTTKKPSCFEVASPPSAFAMRRPALTCAVALPSGSNEPSGSIGRSTETCDSRRALCAMSGADTEHARSRAEAKEEYVEFVEVGCYLPTRVLCSFH
eukprot:219-Rhodomonas_salina.3